MNRKIYNSNKIFNSIIFLLVVLLIFSPVSGQKKSKKKNAEKAEKAEPVIWEPVNVKKRNLLLGPGGSSIKPDLSLITLIKKEEGGSNLKYRIKDGSSRVWVAKIGKEAQSETAAVRLIWALGYKSEINYLVPELTIPGKGTFKNVRLEARSEDTKRLDRWDWKDNPFSGTNELQGLKIMMALLNNWDLKRTGNNIQLFVKTKKGNELQYVISDLGATFGRTGYVNFPIIWRLGRSRNEPSQYSNSKFLGKVKKGKVGFKYVGRHPDLFDDITVEQARWITNLLLQLDTKQIKDAFRAANYSTREVDLLTQAVQLRISELERATRQTLATNEDQ